MLLEEALQGLTGNGTFKKAPSLMPNFSASCPSFLKFHTCDSIRRGCLDYPENPAPQRRETSLLPKGRSSSSWCPSLLPCFLQRETVILLLTNLRNRTKRAEMRGKVFLQERTHVFILGKTMRECAFSTGTNKSLLTAPLIHLFPDPVSNVQNHLPIPAVRA